MDVEKTKIKKSKISVIVPIYNVADFLDRCIESIIAQTYTNLEIILVDDGSPDRCPIMCDEWASKDERITVIHKKNGGLSDARNVGIEAATGDYLMFIDSDDYIALTMCECLLKVAQDANADIAVCNFWWMYPDHRELQLTRMSDGQVVDKAAILEAWMKCGTVDFVVAWNKLYRKELFFTSEHIRYPVGRLHEDEFTTYKLLYAATRVVFVSEPLYFYVQRKGSIMACYNERNLFDNIEAIFEYIQWAKIFAPEKRRLMEYLAFRAVLMIMHRCDETFQQSIKQNVQKLLLNFINREICEFRHNPYATKKDYIKYVMFRMGVYIPFMKMWRRLNTL